MEKLEITRETQVIRLQKDVWEISRDLVIAEYPFALYGNGQLIREFNCTPEHLEELAAGALFAAGCIGSWEDILSMEIDVGRGEARVSYKEQPTREQPAVLSASSEDGLALEEIYRMMEENLSSTELFEKTGGVHSVSLYSLKDAKRLLRMEDAARHNAVDKILGCALREQLPLEESILVVSGRVSGEILGKARTGRIPVVLSKAAPTAQSVETAEASGITLIGFIRNTRMNIYTHPQRVCLPDQVYGEIAGQKRKETVMKSRYLANTPGRI